MEIKEERMIIRVGGSKGITLPLSWLAFHNADLGTLVRLRTNGRNMTITLLTEDGGKQ